MKKTFIGSKGFTLIELVLVIGILAVISVIVLTVLDPIAQFQKANDAKIKSDLSQIQKGLENYYNDNNVYPDSFRCFH
jgi:prepilin-type N-terminal cleavage/methylation domain-containing protein